MRFCSPNDKRFAAISCAFRTLGFAIMGLTFAASHTKEAIAAEEICAPDVLTLPQAGPPPEQPGDPLPVELEADEVESVKKDTVSMKGNATLKRGRQTLSADHITYHRPTDEIEAKGNVVLHSPTGDRLRTSGVKMQVETFIGEAENAEYRLAERDRIPKDVNQVFVKARGTADKIYFDGPDVMRLENVTYSNCVEGQDDVFLTATDMTLDQAIGQGTAKNLKVRFKDVPIFYFPRVSFPISDERKSGFLFPSIGTQEGSGLVLQTPYYWNIAPNYDATFYPRIYSDRGVQVGAEFRYLRPSAEGLLYGEYMPSDSNFDDDDRGAFTVKHWQQLTPRWRSRVDVQWVSDDQYFDDFSNDIQISSTTFLPQIAEAVYTGDLWNFEARLFAYQTVDELIPESREPYDRLPQLRAISKFPKGPYGLRYRIETELVNFQQKELVDGWRWDITPSVRLPIENFWGYVTPKVALRHTSYSLSDVAEDQDDRPSRTVPVFSVNSGVFFERVTSWRGTPAIQTLEPRIFYLYIPEDNQDDLPIFDTGPLNLNNFGNIFSESRFFGRDRVGDTNQVTLALTSRLIDAETGTEWMQGSIGQIFFLEDRDVNLAPDQVLTEDTSDILAQALGRLNENWGVYAYLQYDDDESEVREAKFDLRYRRGPRKFMDFGYRFSRDRLEQITLFAGWPLGSPRWHATLDERYSLRDDENLETRLGVEYDACCWKLRSFIQSRKDRNSDFRTAFIVELELTGLARISSGL